MGRINGWKRQQHYSNLDDAEAALDENGRVKIGVWTHDVGGRIEHIYEPTADNPFIVRLMNTQRDFDEEGRYEYRYQGGEANKEVMRKYP